MDTNEINDIEMIKLLIEIIKWGKEIVISNNNELLLYQQLSKINTLYFDLDESSDDKQYPEPPSFDYDKIAKNVQFNFKKFGYYNIPLEITENIGETGLSVGDAVDDLSDIIRDFLGINWYYENTSLGNAIWYFKFLFKTHFGLHLINLMMYLHNYLFYKNQ